MNRRVLLTGAGSGIGLATAVHLAKMGFDVSALVLNESEEAALRTALGARGGSVEILVGDLREPATRTLFDGRPDIWGLVNNAGFMNAGLLRDVPVDAARHQLEVMVLAPLDLVQHVLPRMLERGQGRIVNVTSAASRAATPLSGWYQAAKAALRELNDALRLELAGTGVEVIDVEPGGFQTKIWDRARRELVGRQAASRRPEAYARTLDLMTRFEPLMGDPADVAAEIGRVLTVGEPPNHLRIGRDAALIRLASDLLPDKWSDRLVARLGAQR